MSLLHLPCFQFLKSICLSACPLALYLHSDILLGREYTSSEAPVSRQTQFFILCISKRRCCERKLVAILFLSTLVPSHSPQFAAVLRTTAGYRVPFLWHFKTRRLTICKNVLVSTSYHKINNASATQLWELQNLSNLWQRLKAVRRCYLLRFIS